MTRTLLICDDEAGSLPEQTKRLLQMGVDVLLVDSLAEARAALDRDAHRFRALAFSPEIDPAALAGFRAEHAARDPESPAIALVAIGRRPDAEHLADLVGAGLRFAVWNPSDASALRFVVNAALTLPSELSTRSELRAPVDLLGSFDAHGTTQQAVVYTLSTRGAFLETPRPLPKGVSMRVTIRLPGRVLTTRALTIHANEPENRRELRWPIGMSVLFGGMGPASQSLLRRFVAERHTHIMVSSSDPCSGGETTESPS